MKESDLRIGNYIYWDGVRVVCGFNNLGELSSKCVDGSDHSYDDILYFKPIPLTEEWLVKFGFEKITHSKRRSEVHGWSAEFNIKNKLHLLETNKNSNWGDKQNQYNVIGFSYNAVWIKYIHSLQNLYFALTGEELTING